MITITDWLILGGVLGFGMNAGLFFIFSNTVMTALAQLKDTQGAEAMNRINDEIQNPLFFIIFMGSALLSLFIILFELLVMSGDANWLALTASAIFFVGCIFVTIIFNVPLNNRLAEAEKRGPGLKEMWDEYLSNWIKWNHVRTAACIISAVLMAFAIMI